MKKTIISILFFGSFGVAMAQISGQDPLPGSYPWLWNTTQRYSPPVSTLPAIMPIFSAPVAAYRSISSIISGLSCPSEQHLISCGDSRSSRGYLFIAKHDTSDVCKGKSFTKRCYKGREGEKISSLESSSQVSTQSSGSDCLTWACGKAAVLDVRVTKELLSCKENASQYPSGGILYFRAPNTGSVTYRLIVRVTGGTPPYTIMGGDTVTIGLGFSRTVTVRVTDANGRSGTSSPFVIEAIHSCPLQSSCQRINSEIQHVRNNPQYSFGDESSLLNECENSQCSVIFSVAPCISTSTTCPSAVACVDRR